MSIDIDRMEAWAKHGAAADPDAVLALIAKLREAEKERDDHEKARTALEETMGQAMVERDALAAHVERWRVAYMKLTNAELTEDADTREVMHLATGSLMSEFDAIAEQTPATSLARRDADILESWAGRLEELADNARENDCPEHSEGMQDAAEETQQEALRIRRQAGVIE